MEVPTLLNLIKTTKMIHKQLQVDKKIAQRKLWTITKKQQEPCEAQNLRISAQKPSVGDVQKRESIHLYTVGGNVNSYSHYRRPHDHSLKIKKNITTI